MVLVGKNDKSIKYGLFPGSLLRNLTRTKARLLLYIVHVFYDILRFIPKVGHLGC